MPKWTFYDCMAYCSASAAAKAALSPGRHCTASLVLRGTLPASIPAGPYNNGRWIGKCCSLAARDTVIEEETIRSQAARLMIIASIIVAREGLVWAGGLDLACVTG